MNVKPLEFLGISTESADFCAAEPGLGQNDLLLLATWLSPAFPVGAFSYSHGLETAIAEGRVRDPAAVQEWVSLLVGNGSGWCDALFLAEAWRAVSGDDYHRLNEAALHAAAMAPSKERRAETVNLGEAFLAAVTSGWPSPRLERVEEIADVAYPVALGAAAAAHGIALEPTVAAFLNGFVANLVSVAVRLVPIGQTEGLRAVAALQPAVIEVAARAAAASLDELGSATMVSDIASMRHETLYSRVFRS